MVWRICRLIRLKILQESHTISSPRKTTTEHLIMAIYPGIKKKDILGVIR